MRLTHKQAKEMGIDVPPAKKATKKASKPPKCKSVFTDEHKLFMAACEAHGLPEPIPEFEFCPGRKWRFDWLFDGIVALEIEGGIWSNGAHVRGEHFLSDMDKYNEAAILGFSVLRCTPDDVKSGSAFALVKRFLEGGDS